MPLDRNKMLRYQVLDRCFRDTSRLYTVTDLLECCNQEMRRYDYRTISRRTIQNDTHTLQLEPFNVEFDPVLLKNYCYRYADTTKNLEVLQLVNPNRDALLQTIETLREIYDDPDNQNPQWQWMLQLLQSLANEKVIDLITPYVSFENNEDFSGNVYFAPLLEKIINHQPVIIKYRPFNKTHTDKVYIHPYHLKQYNSRWFLLAFVEKTSELITFALDRIRDISIWKHAFIPPTININKYYDNITGVTVFSDEPSSTIELKVSVSRYPYVETKPFSPKQKVSSRDDYHVTVIFPMRINNEFIAEILSFGNDVEVVRPIKLRKRIAQIINEMHNMYSNSNTLQQ